MPNDFPDDDADEPRYDAIPVPAATFTPADLQSILDAPNMPATQTKADQARVRRAMSLLVRGNLPRVQAWLDRTAERDPAKAIELFLKVAKFTVPELKAIEVDMTTSEGKDPRKMSIGELQDLIENKYADESVLDGETA